MKNPSQTKSKAVSASPLDEDWAQPWWMQRHLSKLDSLKRNKVDLVMLGDSITHEWETKGQLVWARHFAGIRALNLGFSGDRTENLLWRIQHGEIDGITPKFCVLLIGTNNTGHRMDAPEEIAAGVEEILRQLIQRLPTCQILLHAIFPRSKYPNNRLRINNQACNTLLERIARQYQVNFVDINHVFLLEEKRLNEALMPDFLHLSEQGYQVWAEQLLPFIDKQI